MFWTPPLLRTSILPILPILRLRCVVVVWVAPRVLPVEGGVLSCPRTLRSLQGGCALLPLSFELIDFTCCLFDPLSSLSKPQYVLASLRSLSYFLISLSEP